MVKKVESREPLCVVFSSWIEKQKNQRSLNITGQMAGTLHACIGKILGHMVRPWS